jgi:hypothetical protein
MRATGVLAELLGGPEISSYVADCLSDLLSYVSYFVAVFHFRVMHNFFLMTPKSW